MIAILILKTKMYKFNQSENKFDYDIIPNIKQKLTRNYFINCEKIPNINSELPHKL